MIESVRADSPAQHQHIRELMAEYIAWDRARTRELGLDDQAFLEFYYEQGEEELPGQFAPPEGCLLLATESGEAAGCAAFRRLDADACEMKRLYVRLGFRGKRVGRDLAVTLVDRAKAAGYRRMRLETTTFMGGAQKLYRSLGFRTCEPYYAIPEMFKDISVFMEMELG